MAQSLRSLPIGLFGAVMGIEGLGLACRFASPVTSVPAWFGEFWVIVGLAVLSVLLPAYATKLALHPRAVRDEFESPVQIGFCGTLPVSLTLAGGGLAPYAPAFALFLWWTGFVLLFGFQVWALRRFLAGGIELAQINPGWLIITVGGIVVPSGGVIVGEAEASKLLFGLSAAVAPFIVAILFYRMLMAPPLPEALRPAWFIMLVPPSLIYANGAELAGEPSVFLNGVFYLGLAFAMALLIYSRRFLSWPFGVPWWAFTFPADALFRAAVRHAQSHPAMPWRVLAAATLALAVFIVTLTTAKTLRALFRGRLYAETEKPKS